MASERAARAAGLALLVVVAFEVLLLVGGSVGLEGGGVLGRFSPLEAALVVFGPGFVLGAVAIVLFLRAPRSSRRRLWWVPVAAALAVVAPLVPIVLSVWLMSGQGPT